jgi:hypothetical protein
LFCFNSIPLQEVGVVPRESSAVVPGEQERLAGDKRHVSLTDLNKKDVDYDIAPEKVLSKSVERVPQLDTSELPVVVARKDAVYQGSLHNIPMFNEDPEEYRREVVTTSDQTAKIDGKKSFLAKVAEQIDLSLLKDTSFALFAVSNFLTSLGFNVPYNFANDLASDAKVIEERRHWVIMSIGISNCFGRVILGYLADRKQVRNTKQSFLHNLFYYYSG